MAQTKTCPYCKAGHRKRSAFVKCARRLGPKPSWGRLGSK